MNKQAFKQRMQNLKSYRENNPGKGYWDWKVQAYQNGGDIPLWQQYQYSGPSYQDVLDDLKQNSPSTYNQLQQSKAADSQSSSEIVRYVDSKGRLQSTSNLQGLSPVITSDYLPGVGDAMEVTQIVQDVKNEDYGAALAGLGLLALPGNWLSKIKSKYGKKGLVNSIYNNVAPGSYYDSYIPGGSKKDELKGALKDYLLGKGDKIDPKWENWINSPTTLGSFIAKDNKKQQHMLDVMTAARKEAWQNYLGIPHDDRYLINTGVKENGMPVYRSNVTDVPNVQLRDIAKTTQHKPENTPYVHGDMINSTGGNISVKYKDNGDLRTITTEDIWDLNPFKDANRARMATTTESTKRHMDGGEFPKMGEYEYQYDINGVPYGTTIHEMNHNADYLKNKAIDADANSNLYYWMRSALKPFSRIDPNTDKLTKYYSKPTEQKAYMNQLREFMYANKMIDTRDQIVTPDLIKQAISKLPKGMQSIKKASEQFKSMRSYTKWFNTIPLLGVGAVGANKYFTSNENRD